MQLKNHTEKLQAVIECTIDKIQITNDFSPPLAINNLEKLVEFDEKLPETKYMSNTVSFSFIY